MSGTEDHRATTGAVTAGTTQPGGIKVEEHIMTKATTLLNQYGHEITDDEAIALLDKGQTICNGYRHELLTHEVEAIIRQRLAAEIDRQYDEAARWARLFEAAGYTAELHGTGQAEPFHQEWLIHRDGQRVATIDIDGCGASWHGRDDLWLSVIGPHSDLSE